jgi:two-component system, OmpR family, sensor histidine kinase SenX3
VTAGIAILLAVALTATVTALVSRWIYGRRLVGVLRRVQPEPSAFRVPDPDRALAHLQRTVSAARTDADVALERSRRLCRALDALPQGILVIDDTGGVLARNRAASNFLGVRTADALVDDAVAAVLRQAGDGPAEQRTLELYGPPRRTVVVSATPVLSDGQRWGVIVAIEDVTDRARLEAARTDFVANLSHELKTPVGALALLAETLAGEDDVALVNRLATKMVIEAHRVNRIIEDLLELSRIEIEERGTREPLAVGLVAAEALDRVRHLAEARAITVSVHEPSRRVTVLGDRRQIVSALGNLIENGVKYSDAGSTVEVRAETDGRMVDIIVSDQGIGIPSADLDRIFERFYRVDRARSRETGGTGLGLAIVRHVATNHGGSVSVRSQEGAGSTFVLRLPSGPGPVAVSLGEAV